MPQEPLTPLQQPPEDEGSEARLRAAVELVEAEIVETMREGGPRAYTRAEKLIAVARALRREMVTGVEDVEAGHAATAAGGLTWPSDGVIYVNDGEDADNYYTSKKRPSPAGDLRREQDLSQLEATEARRRRDEAETRVALAREFDTLQDLVVGEVSDEVRRGVEGRIRDIVGEMFNEANDEAENA